MQRFVCENPDDFNSSLLQVEKISTDSKQIYVLFTGTKDARTGLSWCPDCTAAEPLINNALDSIAEGSLLLECPVIRADYRQPNYSYRTDPRIKLKCVPTLMKWKNGKSVASLDDNQCQNPHLIRDLIEFS